MIKLSHFEAFNAVMVSGSMTAAAEALHTAQPNISRSVSALERATGLKLFDRLPGKLVPTSDAFALHEEVKRSFIGLRRLTEEANRIHRSGSGVLRIGAVQSHSLTMIPEAVRIFTQSYPKVSLSIQSAHSGVLTRWVREHSCDIAIVSRRDKNDGVDAEHLYSANAVCILPAEHKLCQKQIIKLSDIAGERFVSFPVGEPLRYEIDRVLSNADVVVDFVVETSYSSIACSLVAKGIGISIVNPYIARICGDAGVVVRPIDADLKHEAIMIFPKGRPKSRFVGEFVALLKEMVSDLQATSTDNMPSYLDL